MSIVANLPEDLSQSLLKDWLNVKEWAGLDTAACNSLSRPQFLRSVVQLRWELPPLTETERYTIRKLERFYRWVYKRGIRLIELDLNDELLGGMIPDFIRYEYILSVTSTVAFSVGKTINKILESCTNLRTLTCLVGSIDFVSLKVSVLRGLKSLELIDSRLFDDKRGKNTRARSKRILSLIHKHCRQLHTLQCPVVYETGKEPLNVGLHCNPGIHTLMMHANTSIIQCITEYKIVNLSRLKIAYFSVDSCDPVATILNAYPNLQEFQFRTTDDGFRFTYFKERCHLEMNTGINLEGWDNLLSVLPRITSLTLNLSVMLSDDRMQALFALVGSFLTIVELNGIICNMDTVSLIATLAMCPHLESLSAGSYDQIDWKSIFVNQNSFRHVSLYGILYASDVLHMLTQLISLESFTCTCIDKAEEVQVIDKACDEYRNIQSSPTVFALSSRLHCWKETVLLELKSF